MGPDLSHTKSPASSQAKVTGSKALSESQAYPVGFGRAFAACLQNAHWGHELEHHPLLVKREAFQVYEHYIMPTVLEAWSPAPAAAQGAASIVSAAHAEDPAGHTKADADTHGGSSIIKSDSSIIHSPAKRVRLSSPDLPSKNTPPMAQEATFNSSDFAPCIFIEEEPDDSGRLDGDWFREAQPTSSRSSSSIPIAHQPHAAEEESEATVLIVLATVRSARAATKQFIQDNFTEAQTNVPKRARKDANSNIEALLRGGA